MSKKLEINLKVWGMSFDELNTMSYEDIKKLSKEFENKLKKIQ